MKNGFYLIAVVMLIAGGNSFAEQPNEFSSSCAASPEELYQKPEILTLLEKAKTTPILTLNSLKGVWQVQGIPFRSDKIGVNVTTGGFIVQIRDVIKPASICLDEGRTGWLRIAIHEPRCPENKNIYVRPLGSNLIEIEAYQTRLVGSARFRRTNPNPNLNVKPQVRPPCARNFQA